VRRPVHRRATRAGSGSSNAGRGLLEEVSSIFKVLSDPTRVKIVFALARTELCVCDLATLLGLSVSAVSHQLRLLRSLKLVKYRKENRFAYYSLDDDHTAQLLQDVLEHVQGQGRT